MKQLFLLVGLVALSTLATAQTKAGKLAVPDPKQKIQVVEASCGQCQFHLKGKGCNLAVRINGKPYFVDGAGIDDFGDAHDKEGFCEAVRKAEVQGRIVKNRFKLTYFKLLE